MSELQTKPTDGQRRRSQTDRREEARERILDAAEELFAKRGYYGVTLREVAAQASSDTALIHYYFASKAGLFDAVIARRAEEVNRVRMQSLERYERDLGDAMTAHGVVQAYLKPTFDLMLKGGEGHRNYGAVIAKINSMASSDELNVVTTPFDPVVHKLVALLRRVRPGCSDADLYWFYHMLSGAITLSLAQTGRIDALSGGLCASSDFAAICERMAAIFGQGFDALPERPARKPAARRKPR